MAQWKSPGSPHPKKALQSHSKIKTMLTVFFDWEGVAHHKYAPSGQLIRSTTPQCSSEVERCNKTKTAAAMGNWRLAASSQQHICSSITSPKEVFGKTSNHSGDSGPTTAQILHSTNFWLLLTLKSPLKGKRFQTIDEI